MPSVFGFSFSELIVVAIVALVVMGPKDLPKVLRKLGQYAGKLRRLAADLRAQSGIDDALRSEGLADDIAEIRKLARGEIDTVRDAVKVDNLNITGGTPRAALPTSSSSNGGDFHVYRDREFPRDGADAFSALPDNAIVYADGLPKSKWGKDPLYVMGDELAELPPEPVPPVDDMLEDDAQNDAHHDVEHHDSHDDAPLAAEHLEEGPPEPKHVEGTV